MLTRIKEIIEYLKTQKKMKIVKSKSKALWLSMLI